MSKQKRTVTRVATETLEIAPCPACGGEVQVRDCGYTSFNPGHAKCLGCDREWDLGYVEDSWASGVAWNKLAKKIGGKLHLLNFIHVERSGVTISRDYGREKTLQEAAELLEEIRESITKSGVIE